MRSKAIEGKEAYTYIMCTRNRAIAAIDGSDEEQIRNAVFFIRNGEEHILWSIKEGNIERCPELLAFSIRDMDVLLGVVGNVEAEENYFSFGNMDEKAYDNFEFIGAVEVRGHSLAFSFDWSNGNTYFVSENMYYNQKSHLFALLGIMRDLGRRMQLDERRTQSEKESGSKSGWESQMRDISWEDEV